MIVAFSYNNAQLIRTMSSGYYADTLKANKKNYLITPDMSINSSFTISAYTTSGTDTIYVSTYSRDQSIESRKVLIDLSTGAPTESIIISTTKKEYYIYDPRVLRLRLQTNGNKTTLFSVSRK